MSITVPLHLRPQFLASYASLIVFSLISMAVLSRLQIPRGTEDEATAPPRALGGIMAQPMFIVAVTLSAFGYGVMSLLDLVPEKRTPRGMLI